MHLLNPPSTTSASQAYRFSTSWALSVRGLAILRLSIATYIFTTIFTTLGYGIAYRDTYLSGTEFTYFTFLTYWGLGFYFLVSGIHSAVYARTGRNWLQRSGALGQVLRTLHAVYYVSVTTFPFIVTAVFWSVLAHDALAYPFLKWQNISFHCLNSVFAFLEILLPDTNPHAWVHLAPLILIEGLYLGLTYISHAIRGYYVYSFLDPANGAGLMAGVIVGVPVATAVVLAVVKGLIWGRKRQTPTETEGEMKGSRDRGEVNEISYAFPKTGGRSVV